MARKKEEYKDWEIVSDDIETAQLGKLIPPAHGDMSSYYPKLKPLYAPSPPPTERLLDIRQVKTNPIHEQVAPAKKLNYGEQQAAKEKKRVLNERFVANNLDYEIDDYGELKLSKLGQKRATTFDWQKNKAQELLSTPIEIAMIIDGAGLVKKGIQYGVKKVSSNILPELNPLGLTKEPAKDASNELVNVLRKELSEKGIISQQKTFNFPWKEPIRKGVRPWGYDTQDKIRDVRSLFKDVKNPDYVDPSKFDRVYNNYLKTIKGNDEVLTKEQYIKTFNPDQFTKSNKEKVLNRFENRFGDDMSLMDKNRYATWDMYLGKPQTQNPMYDISELTKSKKNPVYTIKEEFMNKPSLERRLGEHIDDISQAEKQGSTNIHQVLDRENMVKKENKWIVPDRDNDLFGTMGGFSWEIEKMADGNLKAIANDVWNLQPFKAYKPLVNSITGKVMHNLAKPIGNIEVGKALGIGKPLNVKVGFIVDGNTKKIIKTFQKGGKLPHRSEWEILN